MGKSDQMESNHSTNTLFYSGPYVTSSRVLYTPSQFARASLFYLQECGHLTALKPHVSGRSGLASYLFFVVRDGNGWLEYPAAPGESGCDGQKGEHYELKAGDCVFIDCRKGYSQSSSETLWALSWIHFNGNNMPAVYNKWTERGGKPVFRPTDPEPFISLLDELYATASSEDFVRDVKINTLLSEMIGLLFQETVYEEGAQPTVANTGDKGATAIDVSAIKSYIDTHYQDQLTLELLAERFFFSKHYLARAFKESYGMSVGSYIQLVRISKSKELLRFTDMSIEEIGCECGYNDPNFYSRTFKKVEGCSPSEFRRNWRSGCKEPEESVSNEESVKDTNKINKTTGYEQNSMVGYVLSAGKSGTIEL